MPSIDACKRFKADLEYHKLEELVGRRYEGEFTVDWTTKPGAMVEKVYTHYSHSYATQVVILDEDGQGGEDHRRPRCRQDLQSHAL